MTFPDSTRTTFTDRHQAGAALASELLRFSGTRPVVLALPRGGVPVGYEVARRLEADLDVFVVRKIGMPGHREYAVGAIASGGVEVIDRDLLRRYGVTDTALDAVLVEERAELARREREYRGSSTFPCLLGRTVILVDDGLATGSTMKAALQAVRRYEPAGVIAGVPVGAPEACRDLQRFADDVVCLRTPQNFSAVGQWYDDFSETTDDEVRRLLASASMWRRAER